MIVLSPERFALYVLLISGVLQWFAIGALAMMVWRKR